MSDPLVDQSGWRPPSLATEATSNTLSAADTKATLDAAKKTGFDQGYAEGMAAGRIRGQQLAQALEQLIKSMAAPFAESDAALVKELLELTRRVASAVIYRELENDNESIQIALRGAMDVLGDARYTIELRVHPEDAALCRQFGGLSQDSLVLLEDPQMHRGGLELKSGSSLIDASVEARLAQVMAQLYAEAGLPEPEVLPNTDRPDAQRVRRADNQNGDASADAIGEGVDSAAREIPEQASVAAENSQETPVPLEGELLSAENASAPDAQALKAQAEIAQTTDIDEPDDSREPD